MCRAIQGWAGGDTGAGSWTIQFHSPYLYSTIPYQFPLPLNTAQLIPFPDRRKDRAGTGALLPQPHIVWRRTGGTGDHSWPTLELWDREFCSAQTRIGLGGGGDTHSTPIPTGPPLFCSRATTYHHPCCQPPQWFWFYHLDWLPTGLPYLPPTCRCSSDYS